TDDEESLEKGFLGSKRIQALASLQFRCFWKIRAMSAANFTTRAAHISTLSRVGSRGTDPSTAQSAVRRWAARSPDAEARDATAFCFYALWAKGLRSRPTHERPAR